MIVNVETTPATTPDDHMLATVHASLEPRGLLPAEHLVDKGYTDSQVLVDSQRRFVNDMPLNASNADVRVNFIEYWEIRNGQTQHFSWVTDLRVSKRTVYRLMRGGRARWKIENETFNTLKNQGYNFEHNYGHGEQHLSVVFAMVMMLAFLVDQTQQLCCALFRAVWTKLGSKRLLWERMRALFYDYALQSMRQLFETLFYGLKKRQPLLAVDSS